MDRNPVGPPGGSSRYPQGTPRARRGRRFRAPPTGSGLDPVTPMRPTAEATPVDAEVVPDALAEPVPPMPRLDTTPQQSQAESSRPQSQQLHQGIERSQPILIPNAERRERFPVMHSSGVLVLTGACAPIGEKEIKERQKLEEKDQVLREEYRRKKQSIMKWDAENRHRAAASAAGGASSSQGTGRAEGSGTGGAQASGSAAMSDDEEEDKVPEYQRYVMQPFGHQYGHTNASIAYEEGLKANAYEGFKAGAEAAQLEEEYQKGYRAGKNAHSSKNAENSPTDESASH